MAKSKRPLNVLSKKAWPFMTVALIAEKVITEGDDKVSTVVRIIDRLTLESSQVEQFPKDTIVQFPLTGVIIIKAGYFRGKCNLTVTQISPSGKKTHARDRPMKLAFDGFPDTGHTIKIPIQLLWETKGLYWFEFRLNGKYCGRMSLQVTLVDKPKVSGK
jgi:hypothetical protein